VIEPITIENLTTFDIELSNWCNANCPMCARNNFDGTPNSDLINKDHLTLKVLDQHIGAKIFSGMKHIGFCGMLGDAIMNPECLDIMQYLDDVAPQSQIGLMTNGGTRNEQFWSALGKIKNLTVCFAIDGLEDTNHLYRRNVQWSKLMRNIKAYRDSGGKAIWQYIVFQHNEHQVEQAQKLSEDLGFVSFDKIYTAKWQIRNWVNFDAIETSVRWPVDNGAYYLYPPNSQPMPSISSSSRTFNLKQEVKCKAASDGQYLLTIRADGIVQPCCMLGEFSVHEFSKLCDDPTDINLNYHTLEEILNSTFYKRLFSGINGGADRLQSCYYHCGLGEKENRYQG